MKSARSFEVWDRDAKGDIEIYPLSGYETFRPYGLMCGLRVQYVSNDAQRLSGEFPDLPLVMSVNQARELARALNRTADIAERPPGGEPQ